MGFLPHLQGWRISGQLLWGDEKQNKVKVLGKRGARWGCSVLLVPCPELTHSHSEVWAQFLVGWTSRVWGMLYELRCTRRNVKRCLITVLPGWGCCPALRDIEHPGRRALSFPRASLTPQQSQLTLLDFWSMESLTLGGNRLLNKGQTAQEAESIGTTTFSLPFFANHSCKSATHPKHRSQEAKVPPANIWPGAGKSSSTGSVQE